MGFWQKFFGKSQEPRNAQVPGAAHVVTGEPAGGLPQHTDARAWFLDASRRGQPRTPAAIDLRTLRLESQPTWLRLICQQPRLSVATEVRIAELGALWHALYTAIEREHGVSTSVAVDLFGSHLQAACKRCGGGIRSEMIGMLASMQELHGVALVGAGNPQVERLRRGQCGFCDATSFLMLWEGGG